MTPREAIARADAVTPNAFSEATKLEWLNALEGRLGANVFLWPPEQIRELQYKYPNHLDAELIVDFPHDDLYVMWLCAKIDEANGEYNKYQNSMAIYNGHYGDFVRWFANFYEPAQGYNRRYW